ncbi:hypothetical protein NB16F74_44530 [Escherichia coli]|uniref:Uncharacterized protein n=3 Tax=Enterobacteriaceae TaxID=543 RepID=A0A3S7MBE2_ECOLX|nr:hypothetical protein [Escherichia coli]EDQ1121984.1 hypothetical protein [Salmonella enterica subsp. enterica serovar Saintpaul]EDT3010017.1 hypothetical protein [Salmonella enterica subsp. enterica serovar Java]EDW5920708.1 hypothetical protein [Salmonella enterica subsp. enterica]EDX2994899.1 hypothetical protein [Salmonella enterica subsp. enterica serovar Worthington]EEC1230530.1 hypothetical protein [Salmonella enterica subsp. enterica serovar Enteritidis]EEE0050790.1 hypothetical pro
MMITGNGINTVTVNGKVKHITELDYRGRLRERAKSYAKALANDILR